jgi:hypothetical protein
MVLWHRGSAAATFLGLAPTAKNLQFSGVFLRCPLADRPAIRFEDAAVPKSGAPAIDRNRSFG